MKSLIRLWLKVEPLKHLFPCVMNVSSYSDSFRGKDTIISPTLPFYCMSSSDSVWGFVELVRIKVLRHFINNWRWVSSFYNSFALEETVFDGVCRAMRFLFHVIFLSEDFVYEF
jgi:hypothetical protein